MQIKKEKLAYTICILWGIISLPLSELIYDEIFDSGLLIRIFCLVIVMSPVWLVFGWRWLTENKPMPPKFWIIIVAILVLIAFGLNDDYQTDEIAFVPLLGIIPFLLLVWTFERRNMLWWKKKPLSALFPTKSQLNHGAGSLLELSESISNKILAELRRISPNLNLIIPTHATDSLLCSYALIYLNYVEKSFNKSGKLHMIFAGYKSAIVTNYISIIQPSTPGYDGLTDEEMNKPEIRNPILELLKLAEEGAKITRQNLSRKALNPYYPIYEILRPYVSSQATAQELNSTFDSFFSLLNGVVENRVQTFINKISDQFLN